MWLRGALLAAGFALAFIMPTAIHAEEINFDITNDYKDGIQIEFYSQTRKHAWQGGDKAHNLDQGDNKSYKLECREGEKIYYGAWVKGNSSTYWGVGLNNKYSCDACCQVCGEGDLQKTLN